MVNKSQCVRKAPQMWSHCIFSPLIYLELHIQSRLKEKIHHLFNINVM